MPILITALLLTMTLIGVAVTVWGWCHGRAWWREALVLTVVTGTVAVALTVWVARQLYELSGA